jgi:hypothetical protein
MGLGGKGFRIKKNNGEEICYWVWGWDNESAPAAPGRAGRSRGGIGARTTPCGALHAHRCPALVDCVQRKPKQSMESSRANAPTNAAPEETP